MAVQTSGPTHVPTLTAEIHKARMRLADAPSAEEESHAVEWEQMREAARLAKAAALRRASIAKPRPSMVTPAGSTAAREAASEAPVVSKAKDERNGADRAHCGPSAGHHSGDEAESQRAIDARGQLARHRLSQPERCFLGSRKLPSQQPSASSVAGSPMQLACDASPLPVLPTVSSPASPGERPSRPRFSAPVQRGIKSPRVILSPRASSAAQTRLTPLNRSQSEATSATRARMDERRLRDVAHNGMRSRLSIAGDLTPLPRLSAGGSGPPLAMAYKHNNSAKKLLRVLDGQEASFAATLRGSASSPEFSLQPRWQETRPSPGDLQHRDSQFGSTQKGAASQYEGDKKASRRMENDADANKDKPGEGALAPRRASGRSKVAEGRVEANKALAKAAKLRSEVINLYELHRQALDRTLSLAEIKPTSVENSQIFLDFEQVLALHFTQATRQQLNEMMHIANDHEEERQRSRRRQKAVLRRAEIVEIFGMIDVDHSGDIDLNELLAAAVKVGFNLAEAEQLSKRFTTSGHTAGINIEQFTELLATNEALLKLMDGLLAEGRLQKEREEKRNRGIVLGRRKGTRRSSVTSTHRPSLADLRIDRQRDELLEQQRKRGVLSP